MSWHFLDERSERTDRFLDLLREEQARLPAIWWFELRNVVLVGERRGRATSKETEDFLAFVSALRIQIDPLPDERSVFNLARRHRLTFYDACYLELAKREGIALATLDQSLARAATAEGVPLVGA